MHLDRHKQQEPLKPPSPYPPFVLWRLVVVVVVVVDLEPSAVAVEVRLAELVRVEPAAVLVNNFEQTINNS